MVYEKELFLKNSLLMIFSAGQKPVKDDCTRLSPTNMVIKNHLGETKQPSETESRTKVPAKSLTLFSNDIIQS